MRARLQHGRNGRTSYRRLSAHRRASCRLPGGDQALDLQLDSFDIRLLNLQQRNNLAGAAELAKEVPLSPSAITPRLRRLRDKGAIARDMALLSPLVVRTRVRALVLLQLQQHSETAVGELRSNLAKAEQVQTCFEITGGFYIAVMVIAAIRKRYQ